MKISIIGAGNVGATLAMRVAEAGLDEVILFDIVQGMPQGKALDMMDAKWMLGHRGSVRGTNDYADTAGSDIVVITAGFVRKPGMTREELLSKNAGIVSEASRKAAAVSPKAILIIVTNPLDIMAYTAYKASGFEARRVIGMAGVLDASRYAILISEKLKVPVLQIEPVVLGTHGETMVALPRATLVNGRPLTECLKPAEISALTKTAKAQGAKIVSLLGSGSAYYAPSAGVFTMIEAIAKNTKKTFYVSAYLSGQYGLKDIYLGVPAVLGRNGIEKIIELKLNDEELSQLKAAAASVQKGINKL